MVSIKICIFRFIFIFANFSLLLTCVLGYPLNSNKSKNSEGKKITSVCAFCSISYLIPTHILIKSSNSLCVSLQQGLHPSSLIKFPQISTVREVFRSN